MTLPVFDGCVWPIDPGCLGDAWGNYDDETRQRAISLASATLSRLTAYRVGDCPITVRPAPERGSCWSQAALGFGSPFRPAFWEGQAFNVWQGVCAPGYEVALPPPVVRIDEVKVDGVVLNPDDYRVDNRRLLVWQADLPCPFPRRQDMRLPDTEVGTFAVTYLNTFSVDAVGAWAAGLMAMEYAKACAGSGCKLPSNITSMVRSGVAFEVITGAFPGGLTGIREVDSYTAQFNPKGRAAQQFFDPGAPRHRVATS